MHTKREAHCNRKARENINTYNDESVLPFNFKWMNIGNTKLRIATGTPPHMINNDNQLYCLEEPRPQFVRCGNEKREGRQLSSGNHRK
jgi:hypothetical protein